MHKRKRVSGIVLVSVCVLMGVAAIVLSGRFRLPTNEAADEPENKTKTTVPGDTSPTIDWDNMVDDTTISSPNVITTIQLPAKENELVYVASEFYNGLEFAVLNCKLSKELLYDLKISDLNAADNRWVRNENGTFQSAETYVYLWLYIRNPTSEAIDYNLPNTSIVTLDRDTDDFNLIAGFLYNRDSNYDVPDGVSTEEWVPDLVTFAPGETRDFFLVYFLQDEILENADPAICLNYDYGMRQTEKFRFMRLVWP